MYINIDASFYFQLDMGWGNFSNEICENIFLGHNHNQLDDLNGNFIFSKIS
jgi:hypothetical protein